MIVLSNKMFSKWDNTDELKRSKDSDILAEEDRKVSGDGKRAARVAGSAIKGAVGVGTAAALAGAILGGKRAAHIGGAKGVLSGKGMKAIAAGAGKYGKAGLVAGAALIGGHKLGKELDERAKEQEDVEFYNKRLHYAKKQANRREKSDWNKNMTQRDGYSY